MRRQLGQLAHIGRDARLVEMMMTDAGADRDAQAAAQDLVRRYSAIGSGHAVSCQIGQDRSMIMAWPTRPE
jgi:hypothetical protein